MKYVSFMKEWIDRQYSKPNGILGFYFGEKMVKQHRAETNWTVKILEPQVGNEILELGCGAGYAMKSLLRYTSINKVIGLDISKSMIRSAAFRNRTDIRRGRASVVLGDVKKLNFPKESFHKVFSIHSIYFWSDLNKTIAEIYRILKPKGSVVITLCDGKAGIEWIDIKKMIHTQLIPYMKEQGFSDITILNGPNSRQFHTVAIKGVK